MAVAQIVSNPTVLSELPPPSLQAPTLDRASDLRQALLILVIVVAMRVGERC